MKLTELEPQFLKVIDHRTFRCVDTIQEAQGISFVCPKCFEEKGGRAGAHSIICWSRSAGTPEDLEPLPGRWKMDGTGYRDLTLNGDAVGGGGARSVLLTSGCRWHGFITDGEATSC